MSRFVVGLTGGIGSGKSTVAELFVEFGAALVDTDAIAHELTGPEGAAMPALRRSFGDAIADTQGALDRAAMRQRAFADPRAREQLEGILHPMIRSVSDQRCLAANAPYVILAVPLLVESTSYRGRCQRIAVVDCPEELQVERVMARSRLTADEVRAIMATQATRQQRLAVADDLIANAGDRKALRDQVAALHARYLKLAAEIPKANY